MAFSHELQKDIDPFNAMFLIDHHLFSRVTESEYFLMMMFFVWLTKIVEVFYIMTIFYTKMFTNGTSHFRLQASQLFLQSLASRL